MQSAAVRYTPFVSTLFLATLLTACGGGSDAEQSATTTTSGASAASSSASSAASSAGASSSSAGSTASSSSSSSSSEQILASDDFTSGTSKWQIEQESSSGTVTAVNGVLEITEPAGATLWFKQKFSGNYEIRFTATPIPYSVTVGTKTYTDRISDLNVFWNATVPSTTTTDPDPTLQNFDGTLASYNSLYLYYVGFGANSNTTTRLRRYDGTSTRPQITGYATSASRTTDDTAGDMTTATSLVANTPTRVRIVSRTATTADPYTLKWYANDNLIFAYTDSSPYLSGWFAFRTTVSHWQLSNFTVVAQ